MALVELVTSFPAFDTTVLESALKGDPSDGVRVDETGAAFTVPGDKADLLVGLRRDDTHLFALQGKNGGPFDADCFYGLIMRIGGRKGYDGWMLGGLQDYGVWVPRRLLQERMGAGPYTVILERASDVTVKCE